MKLKKDEILVLKRCKEENKSYGGFEYPLSGEVEAKNWKDTEECGNGLHGWTVGFDGYFDEGLKGNFVILLVNKKEGYIELVDKVKFKKGKIIYNSPDFEGAKKIMKETYPNMLFHWDTNSQGDLSSNSQGGFSTNSQGHFSANSQGNFSTNSQGHFSANSQGNFSTNKQGRSSTNKQGRSSTNSQGRYSTNTIYGETNISKILSNLHATILFSWGKMKVLQGGKDYFEGETIYIKNMEIKKRYTTTPENIEKLEYYEIFVFGSNLNGNHSGGAAKLAKDKFGAIEGQGEGLQEQSYAFPTLNEKMEKVTDEDLKKSVEKLIKTANQNTEKIFLLTKVGCGIAGFDEDYIKKFFKDLPANIIKPKNW